MDCSFSECNLSNIKVDNCRFRDVQFQHSKFMGIVFAHLNPFLLKWSFSKCLIRLCDFSSLDISGTKFIECDLRENDFINTKLTGCQFTDCNLEKSRFQNTNLENADLTTARNYYLDPRHNFLKHARFSYPEVLSLLKPFNINLE